MPSATEGISMRVSSRTPEGDPNHCPICGLDFRLEPSWPARDGPCPGCGHLLWFEDARVDTPKEVEQLIMTLGNARFGPPDPRVRETVAAVRNRSDLMKMLERLAKAISWEDAIRGL
jgi:hypothetical protein